MPPKTKKKVATRTIEVAAADGPAKVRFPYTGEALDSGATKVDIEYTAVVCASLLGCTADHAETIMDVAHLKGLTSLAEVPAMLKEHTEAPKVRYTEQGDTVYLRATRGQRGTWTLVGNAEHTGVTEP